MVKVISFQSYRTRILERLPLCTLSHEEAAPPVGKVCDALALKSIRASVLALLVAKVVRPICQIDLALAPVAFRSVVYGACTIDFALFRWRCLNFFNTRRVSTGARPRLLARCAEEVARLPAVVERNTMTSCIILASLLARRKVRCFGLRQIDLALADVAFLSNLPLECFLDHRRVRTGGRPRVLALCGEEAAPPVVVERNALALCVVFANLLARRKVSYSVASRQPDLAIGGVAFLSIQPPQFFH